MLYMISYLSFNLWKLCKSYHTFYMKSKGKLKIYEFLISTKDLIVQDSQTPNWKRESIYENCYCSSIFNTIDLLFDVKYKLAGNKIM